MNKVKVLEHRLRIVDNLGDLEGKYVVLESKWNYEWGEDWSLCKAFPIQAGAHNEPVISLEILQDVRNLKAAGMDVKFEI